MYTQTALIRKGCCFVFYSAQLMQRHTATHLENKIGESFLYFDGEPQISYLLASIADSNGALAIL